MHLLYTLHHSSSLHLLLTCRNDCANRLWWVCQAKWTCRLDGFQIFCGAVVRLRHRHRKWYAYIKQWWHLIAPELVLQERQTGQRILVWMPCLHSCLTGRNREDQSRFARTTDYKYRSQQTDPWRYYSRSRRTTKRGESMKNISMSFWFPVFFLFFSTCFVLKMRSVVFAGRWPDRSNISRWVGTSFVHLHANDDLEDKCHDYDYHVQVYDHFGFRESSNYTNDGSSNDNGTENRDNYDRNTSLSWEKVSQVHIRLKVLGGKRVAPLNPSLWPMTPNAMKANPRQAKRRLVVTMYTLLSL